MSAFGGKADIALTSTMSAYDGDFNRSTQHFILDGKIECMQYVLKRTDLSVSSQAQPNKVERQLNERRRKALGFEIPADASVASTG
jgi:hypothetical protein